MWIFPPTNLRKKMAGFSADLDKLFAESAELEKEIKDRLAMLKFNS